LNETNQNGRDRNHEKNVNESAHRVVADHSQQPEHDEKERDGPQHGDLLLYPFFFPVQSAGGRRVDSFEFLADPFVGFMIFIIQPMHREMWGAGEVLP
jgi:hypothetical protein